MKRLPLSFFARDATVVAPELLGKVLWTPECSGRIVEVEAYTADDPASHSFGGPTRRNAAMFGPPGRLYVYLIYGMHHCANVVTGTEGDGQAVLLRAVEPLSGLEVMRARRAPSIDDRRLANGPGKLCQAFGVGPADDGADLRGDRIAICDDGTAPAWLVHNTPRIGITKAADLTRRWLLTRS